MDLPALSRQLSRRAAVSRLGPCLVALIVGLPACGRSARTAGPVAVGGLLLGPAEAIPSGPGAVERGIAWRHVGAVPLRCLGWRADCACVGLEGLPDRLLPGDQGTLTLRARPRRLPGRDEVAVRIHLAPLDRGTSDDAGVVSLRVDRIGPPGPLFVPATVHAGTVPPGSHVGVELDLRWDPTVVIPRPSDLQVDARGVQLRWERWDATAGKATLRLELTADEHVPVDVQLGPARAEVRWAQAVDPTDFGRSPR